MSTETDRADVGVISMDKGPPRGGPLFNSSATAELVGAGDCACGTHLAERTTGKSTKLAFDPPSNILMVAFL